MTDVVQEPAPRGRRSGILVVLAFVVGVVLLAVVGAMLVNIFERKQEATETFVQVVDVEDGEMDASVWGQNFPLEYSRFLMMEDDTVTAYGGSQQYDKLARFPAMQRLWNGYAFAVDFREDRSHWYTLVDQKETKRQEVVQQPGACVNCHAGGDAPGGHREHRLGGVQQDPYNAITDQRQTGPPAPTATTRRRWSCGSRARPSRIAMEERGHRPRRRRGRRCAPTSAPSATSSTTSSARTRSSPSPGEGAEHRRHRRVLRRVRLHGLGAQGDGGADDQDPAPRVRALQHERPRAVGRLLRRLPHALHPRGRAEDLEPLGAQPDRATSQRLPDVPRDGRGEAARARLDDPGPHGRAARARSETALLAAIDGITAARAAGATDEASTEARDFHRKAQLRWDFVSSENSTGFHSPQEAARVLGDAMDLARMSQSVGGARSRRGWRTRPGTDPLLQVNEPAVGDTQ